jgi:HEAT repeat protein
MDFRAERDTLLLSLEREQRPSVRAEVAETLCDVAFETPKVLRSEFGPAVVRLLSDAQAEVKCAGLALASEVLSADEAKDILVRALSDSNVRVRVEAAGRLADLALPEARGALAAALEDTEVNVRFEAARGMVALKHKAGLPVLLAALDDGELRFRAAAALAQLGSDEALPRLREVFGRWLLPVFDRTQVAGALAVLGDAQGVAHLFKRAGKRWSVDRAMAIELLGEVKAAGAQERLLALLADPADASRGAAARGLGRLGDVTNEPRLLAVLDEQLVPDDIKLDVAEALLRLGTASGKARVASLKLEDVEAQAELGAMREDFE